MPAKPSPGLACAVGAGGMGVALGALKVSSRCRSSITSARTCSMLVGRSRVRSWKGAALRLSVQGLGFGVQGLGLGALRHVMWGPRCTNHGVERFNVHSWVNASTCTAIRSVGATARVAAQGCPALGVSMAHRAPIQSWKP